MKLLAYSLLLFALGCSPFVPVTDLSSVPQEQLSASMKVKAYTIESSASYPDFKEILGPITAFSCQFYPTDPPASKGDALKSLRLEALKIGADAIIDVTFDKRGMDPWGTNCLETVQASGMGVKL